MTYLLILLVQLTITVSDSTTEDNVVDIIDYNAKALALNHWFIIIISIIGVIGFFLGIFFYLKTKKEKKLCYLINDATIIEDNLKQIPDLEVLYKGNKINDLSVTKFAFWNNGTEILYRKDIPAKDRMRIQIYGNSKILNFQLITKSNVSNDINLTTTVAKNLINIDFEYLNPNDGGVVQVYHTATDTNAIKFTGDIIGIKKIPRVYLNDFVTDRFKDKGNLESFLSTFISLTFPALLTYYFLYNLFYTFIEANYIGAVFWFFCLSLVIVYYFYKIKSLFKNVPYWLKDLYN